MTIKAMILSAELVQVKDKKSEVEKTQTLIKIVDSDSSNFDRYNLRLEGDAMKKYEIRKEYSLKVLPSIFNNSLYLRLDK